MNARRTILGASLRALAPILVLAAAACRPAADPPAADLSSARPYATGLRTGTSSVSLSPFFYWSEIEGAELYDLYLSTDPSAGEAPLVTGIASIPYAFPAERELSKATTYYWKVVAYNAASRSQSSEVMSFTTIKYSGFPAPVYLGPSTGSSLYPVGDFAWEPVQGATTYRFLCSTAADASGLLDWSEGSATTQAASAYFFMPGRTWYWKVVAEDATRSSEDTSPVWSFTPRVEGIAAPANVSIDAGYTISWEPVVGVDRYNVILNYGGTDFSPASMLRMVDKRFTTFSASYLSPGRTVGFAVVAIGSDGSTSYNASVAAAQTFQR